MIALVRLLVVTVFFADGALYGGSKGLSFTDQPKIDSGVSIEIGTAPASSLQPQSDSSKGSKFKALLRRLSPRKQSEHQVNTSVSSASCSRRPVSPSSQVPECVVVPYEERYQDSLLSLLNERVVLSSDYVTSYQELLSMDKETLAPWLATVSGGGGRSCYVALTKDRSTLIGFSCIQECVTRERTSEIRCLAVAHRWTRHGVGKSLFERSVEGIREQGNTSVLIDVLFENMPARHAYRKYAKACGLQSRGEHIEPCGGCTRLEYVLPVSKC